MSNLRERESVIVPCQDCGGSVSKYALCCPYCEAVLAKGNSRTSLESRTAISNGSIPARGDASRYSQKESGHQESERAAYPG